MDLVARPVKPPRKDGAPARKTRRERAEETRDRMIAAAHEAFVERGYAGTRMADIADAAGVAVQTLYFSFHTKGELLQACFDRAVLGDEGLPPQLQPWWDEMVRAPDGPTLLAHFVRGNAEILRRVGRLEEVVRAASHEPDVLAVHTETERLRREGYGQVIAALARFGLQRELSRERATDVLMTMAGPLVYATFVVDHGWTHRQYLAWQTTALVRLLMPNSR